MNAEIDISNVTLPTKRLILRPWQQRDLDDFYAYASVDGAYGSSLGGNIMNLSIPTSYNI